MDVTHRDNFQNENMLRVSVGESFDIDIKRTIVLTLITILLKKMYSSPSLN